MNDWTIDELDKIGNAEELDIASLREDGWLRKPTTIWVVRHGNSLYVRSVNGREGKWFRGTQVCHQGHIQTDDVDKDVDFEDADASLNDEIDEVYRRKYHRYAANIVNSILTAQARASTLKLIAH